MTVDDEQDGRNDRNDRVWASVASLRSYDVSQRHTRQLRRRYHALLQTRPSPTRSIGSSIATSFQRVLGPAVGVAWCLFYLVEIGRRAAAAYGLLP